MFVELGWHPQRGTFQIDPIGINSAASWVSQPLVGSPDQPLQIKSSGDLLVIMQDDADTQITHRSPYFLNMHQFVSHISEFSALPVRIRFHPRHQPSNEVVRFIADNHIEIDRSATFYEALQSCRAVASVNSSSAVEAMANRIPVLCFGDAIYRHPGATYCLSSNGAMTRQATEQILIGESELFENLVTEMVDRILRKQLTIEQIPKQIPQLITTELMRAKTSSNQPAALAFRDRFPAMLRRLRNAG